MKTFFFSALGGLCVVVIIAAGWLVVGQAKSEQHLDLRHFPAETRQAYQLALDEGDLFVHLPCYCGCAALKEPHRSLLDCFVDGSGEFAVHASTCSTCVEIALAAERAKASGMDHAEIAGLIDELFHDRGPRTLTDRMSMRMPTGAD